MCFCKHVESFRLLKDISDESVYSHLDRLTCLSSVPLCPASGGVRFYVWPHGGSTAPRAEGWSLRGRRPEPGVAGGQRSWETGIRARRQTTASVRQSRSSSDRSHLEQREGLHTELQNRATGRVFLISASENVLLCTAFDPFPVRKGLWLPSMAGLNCPFWGTRLWYVC